MPTPSVNFGNLLKTSAEVWVAPLGTALPDKTIAAGASWGTGWSSLGVTDTPLAFKYTEERFQWKPDQYTAPIDERVTSQSAMFETTIGEFTLTQLGDMLGETVVAGTDENTLTINTRRLVTKYAIGFEGVQYNASDEAVPVRVFVSRATMKLNGDLSFSGNDDAKTGMPLQVTALADPANSGKLFVMHQVTAPPA